MTGSPFVVLGANMTETAVEISSTATAPWHALAGFRSVGVLDIVSTMPARTSVAKATQTAPLRRLAMEWQVLSGQGTAQAVERNTAT